MRQKKNLIMASINMQFQTFKMLLDDNYLTNDEKINAQIATYVDEIIKKSDEYFNNKDYENALDLIVNIKNMFDEGSDNYTKLNAQLEKLNKRNSC